MTDDVAQAGVEHSRALRLIYVADLQAVEDVARTRALVEGGVTAIWLREPEASGASLYRAALALRGITRPAGVALLVGDRVDVALAVEAEGVQLGHRAPPIEALRARFGGWMGLSCHGAADLARARAAGADHAVLSPVFAVPGKGVPLGLEGFRRLLAGPVGLPVVALGGIDGEAVAPLRAAGAVGVAAIRALRAADDPAAVARRMATAGPSAG